MRDYNEELEKRVKFIQDVLEKSNAKGIIYGNSGGKDSTLVGVLCKKACKNVLGVIMPCESKCNYEDDMRDGMEAAKAFEIKTQIVDLTSIKEVTCKQFEAAEELSNMAKANIAPRLRMMTLYSLAQSKNYLVAGTGNRSEDYMGYFTKWGDGAYDFNPISDLTVTEIYEFLHFLKAPEKITQKAPSAGLFEGQTDEKEMGVTYKEIDQYILEGTGSREVIEKIEMAHQKSEHKRKLPIIYG